MRFVRSFGGLVGLHPFRLGGIWLGIRGVGNCLTDFSSHCAAPLTPCYFFAGYNFDDFSDSLDYLTLIGKITIGRLLTREM